MLAVATLGFVCYRFRLTSASGFMAVALALIAVVVLVRRAWLRRQGCEKQETS
jgi:hypothetical protein